MNLLKLPDYKVVPILTAYFCRFAIASSLRIHLLAFLILGQFEIYSFYVYFQDRVVLKRKLIQAIESEAGFELS